jgi:peptide subunit release factor 1 (eRF1)
VKFVQEKKLIQRYFDEISQDTGKYCFGIEDTLKGLDLGAIETLIVWENLDITRYVLRNAAGGMYQSLQQSPNLTTLMLSRGNCCTQQQRARERSRKVH